METNYWATVSIPILGLLAVLALLIFRRRQEAKPRSAVNQSSDLVRRQLEIVTRPSSFMHFTFEGRIARENYWFGLLASHGVGRAFSDVTSWPWAQMIAALGVLVLIYRITLVSRRLHDIGLSAWWQAPFVAVQLAVVTLGLFMTKAMSDSLVTRMGGSKVPGIIILSFIAAHILFEVVIGLIPGRKSANAYGDVPPPTPLFPSTM
jgi:uncharacterized membrane protein YhaH (DUF805 family)